MRALGAGSEGSCLLPVGEQGLAQGVIQCLCGAQWA